MIHDKMENLLAYIPESCRKAVSEYLAQVKPEMDEGIIEIVGRDVYGRTMSYPTKLEEQAKIEAHDVYVDIQFTLSGAEGISLFPREELEQIAAKPEKDFYEYGGNVMRHGQVANLPGYFTLIFPHEAHRPQESIDRKCAVVKKGVIKIKAELFAQENI